MQRIQRFLQFGQILLVHQLLHQVVARHVLLVHQGFHQLVLVQKLDNALQAFLNAFVLGGFAGVWHG